MRQGRPAAFWVGVIALLGVLAGAGAVRHIHLTYDSMVYALASQSVLAGRGLRAPVFALNDEPDAAGTVPLLFQPPGMPLVLAALGGVRAGRLWPGQAVNVLAHSGVAVLCYLLALPLAGRRAAAGAGMAAAMAFPLLYVAHHLWSESLFVALMLGAVWLLARARTSRRPRAHLAGSGLVAAGAVATRFAGAGLLAVFLWEAAAVWKRRGARSGLRVLALAGALPAACLASLLARNALLAGSVRGGRMADPGRGLFEAAGGMAALLARNLGFWGLGVKAAVAAGVLAVPATGLFLAVFRRPAVRARLLAAGLDIVLVALAGYFAVMTWAMSRYQDVFEYRFGAPAAPLMIVLAAVIVERGWRAAGTRRLRRAAPLGALVSLVLLNAYVVQESVRQSRMFRPQVFALHRPAISHWPLGDWLSEHAPAGTVVATNKPAEMAFFRGCPAIYLPERAFSRRTEIPADLERMLAAKMSSVGAGYLVLVAGPEGLDERATGEFVARLSRRDQGDGRFALVFESPEAVAYALRRAE